MRKLSGTQEPHPILSCYSSSHRVIESFRVELQIKHGTFVIRLYICMFAKFRHTDPSPDHEVYCTSAAVVYLPSISHSSGRRYDFWASRCQWRLGNHISGVVPVQLQQFVTSTTSGEIARVMSRTAGTEETFKLD